MTNRRSFSITVAFVFLLSAFCLLRPAFSQSATATLSGTVTDQNNAVVPGATITLVNNGTTLQRQATTNDEGYFTIPLLPPGTYTLNAQRDGFAPVRIDNVVLNVGDQKSLQIPLKAGPISEMVKITSDAPLINESPAVATIVDRQFVGNLPLNGRSFQTLITLSPGVVLTKATFAEQGQFSVNGQRGNANYFTVDGVSANIGAAAGVGLGQSGGGTLPAFSAFGGTNNLVSVDALQEFKMQTSSYAPEFGRTPGAQVQILTRSGTNQYHGSVFEYFRNEALDANDWIANSRGLPKPPLRQHQFGGVLGGPIVKNRSFFFFSYEGLRLRQPAVGLTDVPSQSARQNAPAQLKPFVNAYPVPNGTERVDSTGRPNGLAEFSASFANPTSIDATSIRVDHVIGKLALFGRYSHSPSDTAQRGVFDSLNTTRITAIKTQTLTAGATQIVSQNITNEFRFNYSRNRAELVTELDEFGNALRPEDSIIFPSPFSSSDASWQFSISGTRTLRAGILGSNLQRQLNLVDNVSLVRGNHQLKFGVDYRRLSPISNPALYLQNINFTGMGLTSSTPPSGTINSGIASLVQVSSRDRVGLLTENFSAYWQDTWKAKQRLTLIYGLRWDVNPAPKGTDNQEIFTVQGFPALSSLSLAPAGTPLYQTAYKNFAPRIGMAYRLFERSGLETILRGGVGIFYDTGIGVSANAASNFPFVRARSLAAVPFPLTTTQSAPIPLNFNPPYSSVFATPDLKAPRTYQWNVTLEQSLGSHQILTASYVAAVGRELLRLERLIRPNQNFSDSVFITRNGATSDYHALQVKFERRLSRGVQGLASYTFSKSIDMASNDSDFSNTPAEIFNPNLDRGPSDFDVRHVFSGALTYDIPKFDIDAVSKAIVNGFSVDMIATLRSATPVNVIYNRAFQSVSSNLRPDVAVNAPLYLDDPDAPGGKRFNAAAFSAPVSPRQGTFGRNVLRGFPVSQVDLSLRRQFSLTDRICLQLRAEFFNIFNHPNFADPSGNLGSFSGGQLFRSSAFGVSASMLGRGLGSGGNVGGLSPLYQIGGPRSAQLAVKLQF